MSDDEMNIDEGALVPATLTLANVLNLSPVAAGGAVRRRGRGFQNTGPFYAIMFSYMANSGIRRKRGNCRSGTNV